MRYCKIHTGTAPIASWGGFMTEYDPSSPDIIGKLAADMPKLQNGVKYLKGRVTSLNDDIDEIKMSDFQQQILNLDHKIDSVGESILTVSIELAIFMMDFNHFHLAQAIDAHLFEWNAREVQSTLDLRFGQAKQAAFEARDSMVPLKIAAEFRSYCMQCSKDNNLKAYGQG